MTVYEFFKPILKYVIALFIVILVDFLTGVSGALVLKKFKSSKFRSGIDKYIKYSGALILTLVIAFLTNQIIIVKAICILIITIEGSSIVENIGNKELKEKIKIILGDFKNVTK